MAQSLEAALKKVAKGTGIVLAGTVTGVFLQFLGRIIIVRYLTQSEYGILSITIAILSVTVTFALLGFREGVPRYISYYRGKKDTSRQWSTITSALWIVLLASIGFGTIIFLASGTIARIFHTPELELILKMVALATPFDALIYLLVAIFRGFDRVEIKVYFHDILLYTLHILLFITAVFLKLSFMGIIYAYLGSYLLTALILAIYSVLKIPQLISKVAAKPAAKRLVMFSLPLLVTNLMLYIMNWTDTLMLGYFKNTQMVGLYNAAAPIAKFIPVVLASMVFIYTPTATIFFSKDQIDEIRTLYASVTKWVFSLTIPLIFMFLLYPDKTIALVFGSRYSQAAIVLQLLSLGAFVHTFLGPNRSSLIVVGKSKLLMIIDIFSGLLNVSLNLYLIPRLGITGAAIASFASITIANILVSIEVYRGWRISPFSLKYVKVLLLSVVLGLAVYCLGLNLVAISKWFLPFLAMLYFAVYMIGAVLIKSFDTQDVVVIKSFEEKLGIRIVPFRNMLQNFVAR